MNMKRKAFIFALTVALMIFSTCSALTPTLPPTPRPTPSPTPSTTPNLHDSCRNHIHLRIDGLTSEPGKHLLYSHEHGIMADGILMFMPLEEYVEQNQIPVISRDQFLTAFLSYDSYVESFSSSTVFYQKTESGLTRIDDSDLSLSDLPKDIYLIQMDCNAVHSGESYRFFYLFWTE